MAAYMVLTVWLGTELVSDVWEPVRVVDGVHLYHQLVPNSPVPAIRAEARLGAPPDRILAGVTDYDHFNQFMPNIVAGRIIAADGDIQWVQSTPRVSVAVGGARVFLAYRSSTRAGAGTGI